MLQNKKGVSEVVANVLIVLLVIVGVAVVWAVVKPTLDKSSKQIAGANDCFGANLEVASLILQPLLL
jgi:FlaG/FlaF family flagellin (archaellin)